MSELMEKFLYLASIKIKLTIGLLIISLVAWLIYTLSLVGRTMLIKYKDKSR